MAEVMATGRAASRTRVAEQRSLVAPVRPSLWQAENLLRWAVTAGLGGILIAVAWYVAAGEATFSQQVGPIDLALAGLLVSGVGNLAWLVRGRRALGERRRLLLPDVVPAAPVPVRQEAQPEGAGSLTAARDSDLLFVAGEGMERYHRSDCVLASGRTGWVAMTSKAHEAAGRRPCGVCRP